MGEFDLAHWLNTRDLGCSKTSDRAYAVIERVQRLLCVLRRKHYLVDDHCGRPEHRYCLYCFKGGSADRGSEEGGER